MRLWLDQDEPYRLTHGRAQRLVFWQTFYGLEGLYVGIRRGAGERRATILCSSRYVTYERFSVSRNAARHANTATGRPSIDVPHGHRHASVTQHISDGDCATFITIPVLCNRSQGRYAQFHTPILHARGPGRHRAPMQTTAAHTCRQPVCEKPLAGLLIPERQAKRGAPCYIAGCASMEIRGRGSEPDETQHLHQYTARRIPDGQSTASRPLTSANTSTKSSVCFKPNARLLYMTLCTILLSLRRYPTV